ncbi:MAG: lipocalin-like domain-containing protein [Opitutales bacterium]|nr:lipocalin-like domain-containing protein [Opitutales bacterium]
MKTHFYAWYFWAAFFQLCSSVTWAEVPEFTTEGFRVPQPGSTLQFPRDHGSHPDYKIEWWYLTGHLQSQDQRAFGFQATFFRFAAPLNRVSPGNADFGNSQLFSSQVALTDIEGNRFLFDERFDRNGWDASASTERLSLKHGPWSLEMTDTASEQMQLQFNINGQAQLNLELHPSKPKLIFGEDGTSRKGAAQTARSYYITFSRLETTGTLVLDEKPLKVIGEAWMDHEIASQQLSADLQGWDWTAIQLNDGREIKAYILRQEDGTASSFSRCIWIGKNGETHYASPASFTWERVSTWQSPETDTAYPTTVRLSTIDPEDGQSLSLTLIPMLDNQEVRGDLNGTYYWEGACEVHNSEGESLGKAYLELAGYHDSLGEKLR